MSRIAINRNKSRLKRLTGIRARLVLLALVLVTPLMVERLRSLEEARAQQIGAINAELSAMARRAADAQREVISSVEAVLKSAAYIHASASHTGRSCAILRASLRVELPWIRTLSVAGADGIVRCSTLASLVNVDVSDRIYFQRAMERHDLVISDYLRSRDDMAPIIVAAYPVSAVASGDDALIVASLSLDWLSQSMTNLGGRAGVTAVLVDSTGTILATPPDQKSMIGRPLRSLIELPADAVNPADPVAPITIVRQDEGKRSVLSAPLPGTGVRLIVDIDEARVSASINRDIRIAYIQLAIVCLLVLLGALIAAERLIVRPIGEMTAMAKKFGQGDWSARAVRDRLPAEFAPLARAFNAMAAQLGKRERELVATNHRLTVMASIDMLSGLANRRGFQSRLDFEWLKAQQAAAPTALLMIDVDHFKLYNDSYGHPEGDACLSRLGGTLAEIATRTRGFAARYGGEEFCLLLPDTGVADAMRIGELVRTAVGDLAMPHRSSAFAHVTVSVGVACATPTEALLPRDLIEAADAALYAAKHRSRNTVVEHGLIRGDDAALAPASEHRAA